MRRLSLFALALVAAALAASCGAGDDDPAPAGTEPSPAEGARPAPEPERRVWVGVEGADRTVLVDLDAREVIQARATPGGPHNVTVAPDGTAAAALYASTGLALIRDGQARIVELGGTPHDVKASAQAFVVANEAGRRIDLVGRDGERGPSIRLRAEPHDLAIAPGGGRAWVTLNGSDELAVVDLQTAEVIEYVPTGQRPHDLLFAPDGRLWVTDWGGLVHVFTAEGEREASLELGVEAHHLAFTPDGAEAWITDHGADQVFVLDARAVRVIDSLPTPGSPHHVAITPDGDLAAVADHTNGTLVLYEVTERRQVATIPVGDGPHGVWSAE